MKWYLYLPFSGIPYRQLYFLQLENYDLARFVRLLPESYRLFTPLRQELVWTPKMVAVANLSFFLEVVLAALIGLLAAPAALLAILIALFCFLAFLLFHFVFLMLTVAALSPFDTFAKRRIVSEARAKLAALEKLTVIAVAGSYGKTTVKEMLAAVLSEKFKTLATPGNVNTPIGISRVILRKLTSETEVFIVEMGEHYPGDLRALTELARPDITVITGINEAHMERFGTFDRLLNGIFEAADGTKENGLLILNADNPHIVSEYTHHRGHRDFAFYSAHGSPLSEYLPEESRFREDGSGMTFRLSDADGPLGEVALSLIGGYAPGAAVAAVIAGRRLGMAFPEIVRGLAKVNPAPHRLEIVPSGNGVLVIDDSYNGNPEGARYAIEALARFKDRRKVYITPGLVESGVRAEAVHREIGKELAGVADVIVLIRNSVTPFIADELEKKGFTGEIHWFKSAADAHAAVPEIVRAGDVIVFQNDWPDNYR